MSDDTIFTTQLHIQNSPPTNLTELAFIILYIIMRLPSNPVTGRGAHIDTIMDIVCKSAPVV
jgi:hypothetical protein